MLITQNQIYSLKVCKSFLVNHCCPSTNIVVSPSNVILLAKQLTEQDFRTYKYLSSSNQHKPMDVCLPFIHCIKWTRNTQNEYAWLEDRRKNRRQGRNIQTYGISECTFLSYRMHAAWISDVEFLSQLHAVYEYNV